MQLFEPNSLIYPLSTLSCKMSTEVDIFMSYQDKKINSMYADNISKQGKLGLETRRSQNFHFAVCHHKNRRLGRKESVTKNARLEVYEEQLRVYFTC